MNKPDFFVQYDGDGWWDETPRDLACTVVGDADERLTGSKGRYWLVHVEPGIKEAPLGPVTNRALVRSLGKALAVARTEEQFAVPVVPIDPRAPSDRFVFAIEDVWSGVKARLVPGQTSSSPRPLI